MIRRRENATAQPGREGLHPYRRRGRPGHLWIPVRRPSKTARYLGIESTARLRSQRSFMAALHPSADLLGVRAGATTSDTAMAASGTLRNLRPFVTQAPR